MAGFLKRIAKEIAAQSAEKEAVKILPPSSSMEGIVEKLKPHAEEKSAYDAISYDEMEASLNKIIADLDTKIELKKQFIDAVPAAKDFTKYLDTLSPQQLDNLKIEMTEAQKSFGAPFTDKDTFIDQFNYINQSGSFPQAKSNVLMDALEQGPQTKWPYGVPAYNEDESLKLSNKVYAQPKRSDPDRVKIENWPFGNDPLRRGVNLGKKGSELSDLYVQLQNKYSKHLSEKNNFGGPEIDKFTDPLNAYTGSSYRNVNNRLREVGAERWFEGNDQGKYSYRPAQEFDPLIAKPDVAYIDLPDPLTLYRGIRGYPARHLNEKIADGSPPEFLRGKGFGSFSVMPNQAAGFTARDNYGTLFRLHAPPGYKASVPFNQYEGEILLPPSRTFRNARSIMFRDREELRDYLLKDHTGQQLIDFEKSLPKSEYNKTSYPASLIDLIPHDEDLINVNDFVYARGGAVNHAR